jgi:hypothetical protein
MNHRVGSLKWSGVRPWVVMIGLVLVTLEAIADPSRLYRYTKEDGSVVLDFSVPPEYVHRGYSVLTPGGMVIQEVPPALTDEQRAALEANAPEAARRAEMAVKERQNDLRLMAIYASPEDAIRARDRKTEVIDLQMSADRGNIGRLRADFDVAQESAANRERAGLEVPPDTVEHIDRLLRQINALASAVELRQSERDAIVVQYEQDIQRMRFLVDNPEIMMELKLEQARRQGR